MPKQIGKLIFTETKMLTIDWLIPKVCLIHLLSLGGIGLVSFWMDGFSTFDSKYEKGESNRVPNDYLQNLIELIP